LTAPPRPGKIGTVFQDRTHAGRALGAAMGDLRKRPNVTIVGIARGGVEVAAEVAAALDLPLEVLPVRKVRVPTHPDLAVGAVAPQGERYTNRRVAGALTPRQLDEAYDRATAEAREMDERLRAGIPLTTAGRVAMLVDDGAATGASVRAAMAAVRNAGARSIGVALPVAPRPTAERLARECDRLVVLSSPARFRSIAEHYASFPEVDEARSRALMHESALAFELQP
jgi:putative phosphoribosyl transferase